MIIIIVLELFSLVNTYYTTPQPYTNSKSVCLLHDNASKLLPIRGLVLLRCSNQHDPNAPTYSRLHNAHRVTANGPEVRWYSTPVPAFDTPAFTFKRGVPVCARILPLEYSREAPVTHPLFAMKAPAIFSASGANRLVLFATHHRGSYLFEVFSYCYATANTTPMFLLIRGPAMLTG